MFDILSAYGINLNATIQKISGGLINSTWKVTDGEKDFILQQINTNVFQNPKLIADNNQKLSQYLKQHHPDYLFVSELTTIDGQTVIETEAGCFRLLPFVKNSHTSSVVQNPAQAYEAAKQFGLFTKVFSGFDAASLSITIPNFHNLELRYQQFQDSVHQGNQQRVGECKEEIERIEKFSFLVDEYKSFVNHSQAKIRVTHHDTKISNVLFDSNDRGLCVIDLDTVMPGYFFSDVGDMMRTYLSPVSEEVTDLTRMEVREEFFKAIATGYLQSMGDTLTSFERNSFSQSGLWLIYMQALRFLADHFKNDRYYGALYPNHNYFRAANQLCLLQKLNEQQVNFRQILNELTFKN
jgi:thiamine kinase-like enzyme